MNVLTCIFAFACFAAVNAGKLPTFIKPCSASDPNLNECIARVIDQAGPLFAEGIPELGIAPLDPVQLGRVDAINPALKIVFTDTVVTGLKGLKVNAYKINLEKGRATFDFTSNVTLKANYDMDGRVLIIPIRGNGQAKIKITNLNIVVTYDFDTKDGHWVVTDYKDHYKMDKAQFKFNNLFEGNKELGETVYTVLNRNWESVIKDIAPTAFEQIIKACVDEVNKFFAAVPAQDLLKP